MKLSIVVPNQETYKLSLDKTDKYGSDCSWADFSFNKDFFILDIHSDCGSYRHVWLSGTKGESFLNLMSRIDDEYLLDKISTRNSFDIKESKKRLIEEIELEFLESNDKESIIHYVENYSVIDINSFFDMMSINEKIAALKWNPYTFLTFNHPTQAKTICKIFKEYIQPMIRKEIGID